MEYGVSEQNKDQENTYLKGEKGYFCARNPCKMESPISDSIFFILFYRLKKIEVQKKYETTGS